MTKQWQVGQGSLFQTASTGEPSASLKSAPHREFEDVLSFLGTSAFTADGWAGSFYPIGMKPSAYIYSIGHELRLGRARSPLRPNVQASQLRPISARSQFEISERSLSQRSRTTIRDMVPTR
jgi:hypothetical protein